MTNLFAVLSQFIMSISTPRQLTRNFPSWLVLMGLLTAMAPLAIDMYLPAFPAIALDLKTTEGNIERTLASYLLGMALAQLFYGPIADRFGRKIPLIFGLLLFSIASFAIAFTHDIEHLLLWRVAQAFGGAAGAVIPRAVIRDQLDTRDAAKALSLIMLIMGATPILAPILGGQILLFAHWRIIFYCITFCGVALFITTILYMRETLAPQNVIPLRPKIIFSNYKALLKHKPFLFFSMAAGFGSAGMFAYISGSPRTFISAFDVPTHWFGLLFGINALSLIVASQIGARLLNYFSPQQLLSRAQNIQLAIVWIGLLITIFGIMDVYKMMAVLMCFMACQGFINPNAAALALSEQGHRLGVASALMGTLQMLCGALAGLAISLWQDQSALPLSVVLCAAVSISWFSGSRALKHSA